MFEEELDLTSFTTSGRLDVRPERPISVSFAAAAAAAEGTGKTNGSAQGDVDDFVATEKAKEKEKEKEKARRSGSAGGRTTPTQDAITLPSEGVRYRLVGFNVHYGNHGWGHYVSYRRLPSPHSSSTSSHGWLRISDADVQRVTWEEASSESSGVFMLFYERVSPPTPPLPFPFPSDASISSSASSLPIPIPISNPAAPGFANRLHSEHSSRSSSPSPTHSPADSSNPSPSSSLMLSRSLSQSYPSTSIARTVGIGSSIGWREARGLGLGPPGLASARTASDAAAAVAAGGIDLNRIRSPSLSSQETVRPGSPPAHRRSHRAQSPGILSMSPTGSEIESVMEDEAEERHDDEVLDVEDSSVRVEDEVKGTKFTVVEIIPPPSESTSILDPIPVPTPEPLSEEPTNHKPPISSQNGSALQESSSTSAESHPPPASTLPPSNSPQEPVASLLAPTPISTSKPTPVGNLTLTKPTQPPSESTAPSLHLPPPSSTSVASKKKNKHRQKKSHGHVQAGSSPITPAVGLRA